MTNPSSASDVVIAPILAVGLVLACVGWGELAQRLVARKREPVRDTGSLAAAGFCTMLALGGFAVRCDLFSIPLIVLLLGPAVLPLRRVRVAGLRDHPWELLGGLACFALWLLWIYVPAAVNGNDDGPAYLAFARKVVETGGLGPEPFSERRFFGLGGNQLFMATVLTFLPERWLGIVEPCLGVALMILVLLEAGRRLRTPPLTIWLLSTLLLLSNLAGSKVLANLMPAFLMVALTGTLLLAVLLPTEDDDPNWILVCSGLACGGLVALRTTALPVGGLLLLAVLAARRPWKLSSLVLAAVPFALVLLPWMLSSWRASHTLLFPFLGRGWHGSATSGFPAPNAGLSAPQLLQNMAGAIKRDPLAWLTILLTGLSLRLDGPRRLRLIGCGLVCIGTDLLLGYATGGTETHRYAFPFFLAFILLAPLVLGLRLARVPVAVAGALGLVLIGGVAIKRHAIGSAIEARLGIRYIAAVPTPKVATSYRLAQDAVPPGSTLLAGASRAYLLDFRRNPIALNDQPGAAGPLPGWPRQGGAAAIRKYLREAGMQYLLIENELLTLTLPPADQPGWLGNLGRTQRRWMTALRETPFASHVIYRDDELTVFSLAD